MSWNLRFLFPKVKKSKMLIFLLIYSYFVVLLFVIRTDDSTDLEKDTLSLNSIESDNVGGISTTPRTTAESSTSIQPYFTTTQSFPTSPPTYFTPVPSISTTPPFFTSMNTQCLNVNLTQQPMLTAIVRGRLGNQMFSYATLFSIAIYNNRSSYVSPQMYKLLSKYFKISMCPIPPHVFKRTHWISKRISGNYNIFNSSIRNMSAPHVMLTGFPESWKYFDEYRSFIRNEFQFHEHITNSSKSKIIETITQFSGNRNTTIVGVHVRRRDYIQKSLAMKLKLPTMEYYIGAMTYFITNYENVIFIIVSDDVQWCITNFLPLMNSSGKYKFNIEILNGTYKNGGLDLAVLSLCNHTIFGIGTFGFWGGYLSGGETIFCSNCITSKSLLWKHYGNYQNFVLPSWKGYTMKGTPQNLVLSNLKIEKNRKRKIRRASASLIFTSCVIFIYLFVAFVINI